MEVVRRWLAGMTAGIAFLHSRGLVHRDLKPANVFSDTGVVKIGDVGLSKFITPSRRSAQTQSVGTVYYMAPEVARGRYGKEVDTYALGIILYEMLTGHVPFDGESAAEILMKHLSETPDLTRLPPRIRPVIARALEKDPGQRFASIEEFAQAFDDAVLGKYVATTAATPAMAAASVQRSADVVGQTDSALAREWGTLLRLSPREWVLVGAVCAPVTLVSLRAGPDGPWTWLYGVWCLFLGVLFGYVAVTARRWYRARGEAQSPDAGGNVTGAVASSVRPPIWDLNRPAGSVSIGPAAGGTARLAINPYAARQRVAQWMTAAALSTGLVTAFTAGIALVAPSLLSLKGAGDISPEAVALFSGTSIVGAWLAMLAGKVMDRGRPQYPERDGSRRLALLFAGLATGAVAWGLGIFLQLDGGTLFAGQHAEGVFRALGERPLIVGKAAAQFPTLPGYMVFFGGLFASRAWWRQIELRRDGRFYSSSVLMTIFVAWLWSVVFVFPQTWAMLWAAMISTTVQLASPWSPRSSIRAAGKP